MRYTTRTTRISVPLVLTAWLVAAAGCTSPGTVIDHVTRDQSRADVRPTRALVLAIAPDARITTALETEWTRQLQSRGVEAEAAATLLPGEFPPDEARVIALVKAGRFDTLLLCRLVKVKQVGRDATDYQSVVTETRLYDGGTGKSFWTAQADTFLVSGAGDRAREPRSDRLREFVGVLIDEMSKDGVL